MADTTTTAEIVVLEQAPTDVLLVTIAERGADGASATDHGALSGLEDDDHTQYHTDGRGDARYAPIAHASDTANPHEVTAAQSGADAIGTAATLIAAHSIDADPHAGYALESDLGTAAYTDATDYAVAAKGVTNGDSHDHSGGDGAQIAYGSLSGLPTLGTAAAAATGDFTAAAHASDTANPHAVTKAQVGLSAADNTSDANKPVSTAQQTALNLKANLASPTFTGTVGGITAAMVGAPAGSGTSTGTNTGDSATPAETTATIGPLINSATSKATPVDVDQLGLMDSAAGNVLKKLSWANIKATLALSFALLSGKLGGQKIIGGTGTTDSLDLQSTSGIGDVGAQVRVLVGNNGATQAITVKNDGKVGILTSAPSSELDVAGGISFSKDSIAPLIGSSFSSTNVFDGTRITFIRAAGSQASPQAVINGYYTGWFDFLGYDGATNTRNAQFVASVDGTPSSGIVPGRMRFNTSDSAGNNRTRADFRANDNAIFCQFGGKVGIAGQTNPASALHIGLDNGGSSNWLTIGKGYDVGSGIRWLRGGTLDSIIQADANEHMLFETDVSNSTGGGDFLWLSNGGAERMRLLKSGSLGIGTSAPSAKIHALATTEQARFGYDAANYEASTTSSTGKTTKALVGTSPDIKWTVSDATTNAIYDVATFSKNCTGAGAVGLGARINLAAKSSTTADTLQGSISSAWGVATHATRSGIVRVSAADSTGLREGFCAEADGTQIKTSVNGVAAVARAAALTAEIPGDATRDELRLTELYNACKAFGIIN